MMISEIPDKVPQSVHCSLCNQHNPDSIPDVGHTDWGYCVTLRICDDILDKIRTDSSVIVVNIYTVKCSSKLSMVIVKLTLDN